MYGTATTTATYTVVHIRRVFEGFEADLRSLAGRTALWTQQRTEEIAHDVALMAENQYLQCATLILFDASGHRKRLRRYTPEETTDVDNTDLWGRNRWPVAHGDELSIVVQYTDKWSHLSDAQRERFRQGLQRTWTKSTLDTSTTNMRLTDSRARSSNGYGLARNEYENP